MERKTVRLAEVRTVVNRMIQYAPNRDARLAIAGLYERLTLGRDGAYHGFGYTRDYHLDDSFRFYYGEQEDTAEPIKLWSANA